MNQSRPQPPMRPFYGALNLKDPFHVFYAINIVLTPLVVIACLLTFPIGGWFVGIMWWGWITALIPEEIEKAGGKARYEMSRRKRKPYAPRRKITGTYLEDWYDSRPPGQYP